MNWAKPSITSVWAPPAYAAMTTVEQETPTPTPTSYPPSGISCEGIPQETVDRWVAEGIQFICVPASAEVD